MHYTGWWMEPEHEQATAAYAEQDYELLLSIALLAIAERDQLQVRLDRAQAVMQDALNQLEAWQERKPPTGSPHQRA